MNAAAFRLHAGDLIQFAGQSCRVVRVTAPLGCCLDAAPGRASHDRGQAPNRVRPLRPERQPRPSPCEVDCDLRLARHRRSAARHHRDNAGRSLTAPARLRDERDRALADRQASCGEATSSPRPTRQRLRLWTRAFAGSPLTGQAVICFESSGRTGQRPPPKPASSPGIWCNRKGCVLVCVGGCVCFCSLFCTLFAVLHWNRLNAGKCEKANKSGPETLVPGPQSGCGGEI